jgi:hypothetical protein
MAKTEFVISKCLTDLWEVKDSISREVAHLPTRQALEAIHEMARAAMEELGFAYGESTLREKPKEK